MQENIAYELARFYQNILAAADNIAMTQVYKDTYSHLGVDTVKLQILNQHNDVLEVSAALNLPEHRTTSNIERIRSIQLLYLNSWSSKAAGEAKQTMQAQRSMEFLNSLGDTIATTPRQACEEINREELAEATGDLIQWIQRSEELTDIEKKSLTLKLTAVRRIVQECAHITDEEIRKKVKSVFAECAADFVKFDKKYETTCEKMLNWVKFTSKGGFFALAITADASAVAGLLGYTP